MASATASAPGKVILVGEHFVVEGQPAIAVAVDLRARVVVEEGEAPLVEIASRELGEAVFRGAEGEAGHPLYPIFAAAREVVHLASRRVGLRIRVESDIPLAAGMGSSAAVAVATVAATAKLLGLALDLKRISNLAYVAETLVHGRPSGIDNTVSTYGGAIAYRRGEGFMRLRADFSPVKLVLADSGIKRSTGAMVAKVRALKEKHPSILEPLYYAAGRLAVEVGKALERGDFEVVGELMNVNHGLLSAIGVSNLKLEELVYTARRAGALGAKITGAGGGGLVVALCRAEDAEKIAAALREVSSNVFTAPISNVGVRIGDVQAYKTVGDV